MTEGATAPVRPVIEIGCYGAAEGPSTSDSCGWAFVLLHPEEGRIERQGTADDTTEQRMDLLSAFEALNYLQSAGVSNNYDIILYSGNTIVVNGINSWMPKNWRKNGWRKIDGKPVENQDIWRKIDPLERKLRVRCKHDPANALVREARRAAASAAAALSAQKRGEDDLDW